MLLTKKIKIKVNFSILSHFTNLGYDVKSNQDIEIPIEHLNNGSNYYVDVCCDICGFVKKVKFRDYLKISKFDGRFYCRENKCFIEKVKLSTLSKYNVTNTSKLEEKQKKWKKTNLELYGVENAFQSEIFKEKIRQFYRDNFNGAEWNTQVKEVRDKNHWIPDEDLTGFKKYNRIVRRLTNRNKKKLLESWSGYDFYEGDYIKDNFTLNHTHSDYPTIDHKISLKYGFLNNIPEEIISDIDNLCFTKRGINSKKRCKNYNDFMI
jgi:hypothetical protein